MIAKKQKNKLKKIKLAAVVFAAATLKKYNILRNKKNKCRRFWSKSWLLRRYSGKDMTAMCKELELEDTIAFHNFCRLSKLNFKKLLGLVGPAIAKEDTQLRQSISATTRFLATGNSYQDLSYGFRVSVPAISSLVPETLKVIYDTLSKIYLKGCKTETEWREVADEFYKKWNFPMCLGAIDGKHIRFRPKSKDGSYYFNYKKFNSIILLAVVDADYKFVMVDAGTNGKANDAAAFNASEIGDAIKNNLLNFPPDNELPGTNVKVPYVFVSDEAFRLTSRVLKPYSQKASTENKIFNYRLSRARRVVENVFGMLANMFQIFQREINLDVNKVELITLTCCALHNFLRVENAEVLSCEEDDLLGLEKSAGNNSSEEAADIRHAFSNFFNNVDVLPWQSQAINNFNF